MNSSKKRERDLKRKTEKELHRRGIFTEENLSRTYWHEGTMRCFPVALSPIAGYKALQFLQCTTPRCIHRWQLHAAPRTDWNQLVCCCCSTSSPLWGILHRILKCCTHKKSSVHICQTCCQMWKKMLILVDSLTLVVPLQDCDVSREAGAFMDDSLNREITLSWSYRNLSLGLSTVSPHGLVFTFLHPPNNVVLDVYCDCRARNVLRTKGFVEISYTYSQIYASL